jgi:ATP-dependent protease ClpP protease subunit
MSEDTFIPMFPPKNIFTTEVRGQQHTYYLTGPITEPENYVDLCNILRSSGPQDEILIRINSSGGSVATERMICNAIQESEANVVGFIEYACMSAATTVFLACKQHGWGPHIQFMIHCAWWSSFGKTPDIKSHTEFAHKQMEEEITSTYKGLLSDEELIQCNEGREFWFGAKELGTRMENFYEYQKSLPCDCGSPDCQAGMPLEDEEDYDNMPTLESIVENAVAKALDAHQKKIDTAARKAAIAANKANQKKIEEK